MWCGVGCGDAMGWRAVGRNNMQWDAVQWDSDGWGEVGVLCRAGSGCSEGQWGAFAISQRRHSFLYCIQLHCTAPTFVHVAFEIPGMTQPCINSDAWLSHFWNLEIPRLVQCMGVLEATVSLTAHL